MKQVNVFSEIGKLKKVMLHRPGNELNNLTPDVMEKLLFDDIPYLKTAQEEHDSFAELLRNNGTEVVYLEDLVAEVIRDEKIREQLIDEYIKENSINVDREKYYLKDLLMNIGDEKSLVLKMMEGTRREEIPKYKRETLYEMISVNLTFVTLPMPNLYFIRDPFSMVGNSVSLNKMWSKTRNRETIFGKYIFKYHKDFKETPHLYERHNLFPIEGGDQIVLSDEVLAIGISQRTTSQAIELFCEDFFDKEMTFKKVLAFVIPKKREFMHLDTVFTMIDKDVFTIHPLIEEPLVLYAIEKVDGKVKVTKEEGSLKEILEKNLELGNVKIIPCGGDSKIDSQREQWSDGSNTLAIAPGEIVVYDRNFVTNRILEENGIKLYKIKSGELSRGRGGPRCMSMPVIRE